MKNRWFVYIVKLRYPHQRGSSVVKLIKIYTTTNTFINTSTLKTTDQKVLKIL
jgi:hypothetical protein